jgi:DNA replication protein DnaC
MLTHPILDKLRTMQLEGMALAFQEQLELNTLEDLRFEKRLALLVDREFAYRDNRRFTRRLRNAKLKQHATLEDIDYKHPRNLDKALFRSLSTGDYLREHHNLVISGPTRVGKTYVACALAHQDCRQGYSAFYAQTSRLLQELTLMKADGRYFRTLTKLAKTDLLILDDWGLEPLASEPRRLLLELLDDRYDKTSTLIASQLPVELWYDYLSDPTLADAILDRVVHNSYRLNLKGNSLRKSKKSLTFTPSAKS